MAVALLLAWAQTSPAWAEMTLSEPSTPNYRAFGWTFLGLSLVAFAAGANGLSQRDDKLNKADAAYKQYQSAKSADDAIAQRLATSKYHNDAKAWESTANVGLMLGVLFAATAVAAFTSDPAESRKMLLSDRGVTLQFRF